MLKRKFDIYDTENEKQTWRTEENGFKNIIKI